MGPAASESGDSWGRWPRWGSASCRLSGSRERVGALVAGTILPCSTAPARPLVRRTLGEIRCQGSRSHGITPAGLRAATQRAAIDASVFRCNLVWSLSVGGVRISLTSSSPLASFRRTAPRLRLLRAHARPTAQPGDRPPDEPPRVSWRLD